MPVKHQMELHRHFCRATQYHAMYEVVTWFSLRGFQFIQSGELIAQNMPIFAEAPRSSAFPKWVALLVVIARDSDRPRAWPNTQLGKVSKIVILLSKIKIN